MIVEQSNARLYATPSKSGWVGTKETGVSPKAIEELGVLGFVETRWTQPKEKSSRRLVRLPTEAGRAAVEADVDV
jgi:hypothetical protein